MIRTDKSMLKNGLNLSQYAVLIKLPNCDPTYIYMYIVF